MDFSQDIERWERKLREIEGEAMEYKDANWSTIRYQRERDARNIRRHIERLRKVSSFPP